MCKRKIKIIGRKLSFESPNSPQNIFVYLPVFTTDKTGHDVIFLEAFILLQSFQASEGQYSLESLKPKLCVFWVFFSIAKLDTKQGNLKLGKEKITFQRFNNQKNFPNYPGR